MFSEVEATGKEMRKFITGSVRDSAEGKGRWDLIPYYPMLRVAVHFANGAKKYGDRNWEKGQPLNEYLSSAMRHLLRFANGENGEDHLSACIWNCMAFMETEKNIIATEKFNLDQIEYLMEKLHPEIARRIRNKIHDKIADAKLKELGSELKEALDKNLFGELNRRIESGRVIMEKMKEEQRKESKGILPEIRVGDNVYVRTDAKDQFNHRVTFVPSMEKMIGKIFKVEDIQKESLTSDVLMYKLRAENGVGWWFTRGSLNKIVETTNEA